MRKATICVGGAICLGAAAIAGVHKYQSVTTKHADAATTTATAATVSESDTPAPAAAATRQPPKAPEPPPRQPPRAPERPAPKPRDPGPWAPPISHRIYRYRAGALSHKEVLGSARHALYNVARERFMQEIKAVERATGARLGKACGVDSDDDDGDDDATPARVWGGARVFSRRSFLARPAPAAGNRLA